MPTPQTNPARIVTIVEIEGPADENQTPNYEYQVIELEGENEIARLTSPSQAHGRAFRYALTNIATLVVPHDILAAMQCEEDKRKRDLADEWANRPPF